MRRAFTLQLYDNVVQDVHAHDCPGCDQRIPCTMPECDILWLAADKVVNPVDLGTDRHCVECRKGLDPQPSDGDDYCSHCGSPTATSPEWRASYQGEHVVPPHTDWCLRGILGPVPKEPSKVPSLAALVSGVLAAAKATPHLSGYKKFAGSVAVTSALNANIAGILATTEDDGTITIRGAKKFGDHAKECPTEGCGEIIAPERRACDDCLARDATPWWKP